MEVTDVLSEQTAGVKLPPFCRAHPVFNVAALKDYHEDDSFGKRKNPPAPIVDLDWYERYVVETILDHAQCPVMPVRMPALPANAYAGAPVEYLSLSRLRHCTTQHRQTQDVD